VALACARKARGCFYRPAMLPYSVAEPSRATVAMAWASRRWTTCGGRRPMVQGSSPAGECVQAAWHQPRPLARVISLRCTVVTAPASDRGVFRRLGLRASSGYDGSRHGVRGRDVAWAPPLWSKPVQVTDFKMKFLHFSKQKCSKG
jgi:hypothetical protein